jgi:hypothetical protein
MYRPPSRVVYSSLFFVLVMALVMVAKPPPIFMPDGAATPFGVGEHHTIVPLGVITVVTAVLSMYTFTLIDLVYG